MADISSQSALFTVLVAVGIFACVSSTSLYEPEEKRVMSCSNRMACRWAICPWSRKPSGFFPNPSSCLIINNESCRCPPQHVCTLTDLMEPSRAQLKYSYRCITPELSRQIYQLGKRSSILSNLPEPDQ